MFAVGYAHGVIWVLVIGQLNISQRPLILVNFPYLIVNIRDHLLSTTTNILTFDGFGIPAIPLILLLASYVELFFSLNLSFLVHTNFRKNIGRIYIHPKLPNQIY